MTEAVPQEYQAYREQLQCNFPQIDELFADFIGVARNKISEEMIPHYLEGASIACKIGHGVEPVLNYLEEMPHVAARVGEEILPKMTQAILQFMRSPNLKAIPDFIEIFPEISRRLPSLQQLEQYLELMFRMIDETSGSIHGFHATLPSPGLPYFLKRSPHLLHQMSLEGLKNWTEYGIRNYHNHSERQIDYFSLQSADSKVMMRKERHGTLFVDNERKLDLYLKGFWETKAQLVPYSEGFDDLRKPQPYYDELGIRIPDVFDDKDGISGINRYRAVLGHIAAHQRWTTAIVADNFSPFQRMAVETMEESRVEYLLMKRFPGMRKIFLELHPTPVEGDCDPENESCILHRLAMLSRAILEGKEHHYKNPYICEFVEKFYALMDEKGEETETRDIVTLASVFIAKTRTQNDQNANVRFDNTQVDYRDDNRHMWTYIEEDDEPDDFDKNHKPKKVEEEDDVDSLPPRHYPEWDYRSKMYRPDWVTLYEAKHASGEASEIDKLLQKHHALAKQLKQILDLLKPQNYVRVRYQEEGSELDLDVAIRSLIDYKSGTTPDPRINMSHTHDGRDIAVMLLIDLSESINNIPDGAEQTILELCQESTALLAWSIEQLGDKFAIAGFHSNTRHDIRYHHIKGYAEHWDEDVKSRLAAMEAGYSTRMGGAIRHAAHYLSHQQADKKLMLILTDGEPSDIDAEDDRILIEDTRKAVQELDQDGIYPFCISLDPHADEYVQDIFGSRYMVIDHVAKLPEKLPKLFASLTG